MPACSTKEQFDPRAFEQALVHRQEQAQAAAAEMRTAIQEGTYDPTVPNFNQATLEEDAEEEGAAPASTPAATGGKAAAGTGGAEAGTAPPPPPVSPLLWKRDRVAADLKLAKRLMVVMDRERGITDNPLLPELAEIKPAEEEGQGEHRRGKGGGMVIVGAGGGGKG